MIISSIVDRIESYKIPVFDVKFIDRFVEIENFVKRILNFEISWCFVIYGPWGCGKSEFFRALTYSFGDVDDVYMIYINLAEEEFSKILHVSKPNVKEFILSISSEVGGFLAIIVKLYSFLKRLSDYLRLRSKKLIIVVDEVTKSLDYYKLSIRDFISSLDKKIHEITKELDLDKLFVILITSDQSASKLFLRERGKSLSIYLMWHLSKKHAFEFLDALKCPIEYRDLICELSGGCPRILIDLKFEYSWNINAFLKHVIDYVLNAIINYVRSSGRDFNYVLKYELSSDPDEIAFKPIANNFENANLLTWLINEYSRLSIVEKSYWIGDYYAWQLPVYIYVIEALIEKGSFKISVDDVSKIIRKFV